MFMVRSKLRKRRADVIELAVVSSTIRTLRSCTSRFVARTTPKPPSLLQVYEQLVANEPPRFTDTPAVPHGVCALIDLGEPFVIADVVRRPLDALEERRRHPHPFGLGEAEPLRDERTCLRFGGFTGFAGHQSMMLPRAVRCKDGPGSNRTVAARVAQALHRP